MEYSEIRNEDREIFHDLLTWYFREGEDRDTPQEEIDFFIDLLFGKLTAGEISGCFANEEGTAVGFALWAMDTEEFDFSEMPGLGTILEIGLLPAYRGAGRGRKLAGFAEESLKREGAGECYVTAYGPAQSFWERCGYKANGRIGRNGLPILVKSI